MALFNTKYSKIVSGSTSFICENSLVKYDLNINDAHEHTSVFSGKRNYLYGGEHGTINLIINLHGFTNSGSKLNEIYSFNHKRVKFYPNYSGSAFKNTGSADIDFYVSDIRPYYLDGVLHDAVDITLKSCEYIDLIKTISGSV